MKPDSVLPPLVRHANLSARAAPIMTAQPFLVSTDAVPVRQPLSSTDSEPLVVVEPHADDAVLSLGGLLLSVNRPVRLLTVFSESSGVHPQVRPLLDQLGVSDVGLRHEEARAAAQVLQADWRPLGFRSATPPDVPGSSEAQVEAIVRAIQEHCSRDSIVLLPAAFGRHPDHVILSRCESAFAWCVLYEDVAPVDAYASRTSDFWERFHSLSRQHAALYWAIDDVLDAKVATAGLFRSQFSPRQARSLAEYATAVGVSGAHLGHEVPRGKAFERVYVRKTRLEETRRRLAGRTDLLGAREGPSTEGAAPVPLHGSGAIAPEVVSTFARRRTRRALTGLSVPLGSLGDALALSARASRGAGRNRFPFPTAGGIGSSGLVILPWNVEGLEPRTYRYDPEAHVLRPLGSLPLRAALYEAVGKQDWVLGASVGFLLDVETSEAEARYGPGAWQLLLNESGHLSQALQIALCDVGLQCVLLPAFDKPELGSITPGRRPVGLVLASGALPTVLPSLSQGALPVTLEKPPRTASEISRQMHLRLRVQHLPLDAGARFFLARCRIPTTPNASTGWSLSTSDCSSALLAGENLSRVRAIAEAREVFVARSARADAVVRAAPAALPGRVALASQVVVDAQQAAASARKRTRFGPADSERTWTRMTDLSDGGPVWFPTDAVMLDRRFFGGELLPTSTGLACRVTLSDALWHATLEVVEKAILPHWKMNWRTEAASPPHSETSLLRALEAADVGASIREAEVAGMYACRVECGRTGAYGSSVRPTREDAVRSALGECFSMVVGGVAHEGIPVPVDGSGGWLPEVENLPRLLEATGLRLAYAELGSVEDVILPLSGWPVVKVVAWRPVE